MTDERACRICGRPLVGKRADARFCGARECRTAQAKKGRRAHAVDQHKQRRAEDRRALARAKLLDPAIVAKRRRLWNLTDKIARLQGEASSLRWRILQTFDVAYDDCGITGVTYRTLRTRVLGQ